MLPESEEAERHGDLYQIQESEDVTEEASMKMSSHSVQEFMEPSKLTGAIVVAAVVAVEVAVVVVVVIIVVVAVVGGVGVGGVIVIT
jgi:hypothetical protein